MLRVLLVAGALTLGLLAVAAPIWRDDSPPRLVFDESVPDDLRALASETWLEFLDAHSRRWDCLPSMRLSAAWELDARAEYHPETARAVVRVPGTPATLRSQMVHEFAHHVEHSCPDHADIREAFLDAQGFAATAGWFAGPTWEDTPSEQYAEATVELVLGSRSHHGNIFISSDALDLVHDWASGTADD